MNIKKAFLKAKRDDEEKVGLNIKIPVSLKNQFEFICKENNVSMTSMMLALIELSVEEYSKEDINYPALNAELIRLEQYLADFEPSDPEEVAEYYERQARIHEINKILNEAQK